MNKFVLSDNWRLNAKNGQITDFKASFKDYMIEIRIILTI